ncbi:MAG: hypothetical protein ACYC5M_07100 [Anaerolineae bacterium]
MNNKELSGSTLELERILESAQRLGVEMDEVDALQWLSAMAASGGGGDVVMDMASGVFGHKVSLLDFSDADLAHYREVGRIVEFSDEPGIVETALALSGSAAQSKIQTYPGDADYFERVNILAATRDEACQILARIMREKALSSLKGPTYQLIEVKFGSYPMALVRGERTVSAGSPIAWLPAEIEAGRIEAQTPDGQPYLLEWNVVCGEPGWCKLDWVVADPARGQLANASNMLDVTWEAPDGTITPLDGYLDPYFQEVYLDAQSVPIFAKLAKQVSADALDDYVTALEREVKKYLTKDVNYGKVAKRMYNIFRLTGRYQEAAFLRELFDEPATLLYQVWSLIRTLDDCNKPGGSLPVTSLLAQADHLILEVVNTLEGDKEVEIVRYLLRLRDSISREEYSDGLNPQAEAARAEVINLVNNFFYDRLVVVPAIKDYMDGFVEAVQ